MLREISSEPVFSTWRLVPGGTRTLSTAGASTKVGYHGKPPGELPGFWPISLHFRFLICKLGMITESSS